MTATAVAHAALRYAEQGLPVFPLHWIERGRCSCGDPECDSPGKHPRTQHGFKDASSDVAQVEQWWNRSPSANIGIPTGSAVGFVVLDVDPRHGGDESLSALEAEHGPLPPSKIVRTGSGCRHVFFVHPDAYVPCGDNVLGPGLDIRGDGGYVVAPPSIHESGRAYTVEDDEPLAPLPGWLRPLLVRDDMAADHVRFDTGRVLAGLPKGRRDEALFKLASKLRMADIPIDLAERIVVDTAGKCSPPLPEKDAIAKVRSAYGRYAPSALVVLPAQADAEPEDARAEGDEPPATDEQLPMIQVNNRRMREISAESMSALRLANKTSGLRFFHRFGVLVRLAGGDDGRFLVEPLSQPALKGALERAADYVRVTILPGMPPIINPARVPDDVVRDLLSQTSEEWTLPLLRDIAHSPLVLPNGRELVREGFDRSSSVLVATGLDEDPPRMGLAAARRLLEYELLGGFPFAEESSRAHAIALLLQPLVRLLVTGPTPIYLIDAPSRGTGKGLLADVLGLVALGRPPAVMSEAGDDSETRKRVTSLLLAGNELILLDNLYELKSGVLSSVLTSTTWADRLLGQSKIVQAENRATWVATGNNVSLSDEIIRRTIPIRLDAGVERPESRTGFRHPRLAAWATDHRAELLGAALTLVRHWLDADRPGPTHGQVLGRFEPWVDVIGGILDCCGISGFLGNKERLYLLADQDSLEWASICELWAARYGQSPISAKDLLELAKEHDLLLDLRAGRSALAAHQRIGRALATHVDRVFGEWCIRASGRPRGRHTMSYRVEAKLASGS